MLAETITGRTISGESIIFPIFNRRVISGLIVTPVLATWILEYAKDKFKNRQANQNRIDEYAGDMASGRWEHNGETIKFNKQGVLVDGYTRCTAAFLNDVSFVTDVATGIPDDAVPTIDTGRARSLSNALSMQNESASSALSHGVVWTWRYQRKNLSNFRVNKISHMDAINYLEQHPQLRDSVLATKAVRNKRLAPPGVLVAAHYICGHRSATGVVEFFDSLESGVGLTITSPIRALREVLLRRTEKHLSGEQVMKLITHAFNKWSDGDGLKLIKVPDEIPKVRGFPFEEGSSKVAVLPVKAKRKTA